MKVLRTIEIRKANWIGHIFRTNCLLKRFIQSKIEGRIEVRREDEEEDVNRYWMTVRKREDLEIERGSIISHSVENSLCNRVWICRKTDYRVN
jgi:hypothetical protein